MGIDSQPFFHVPNSLPLNRKKHVLRCKVKQFSMNNDYGVIILLSFCAAEPG